MLGLLKVLFTSFVRILYLLIVRHLEARRIISLMIILIRYHFLQVTEAFNFVGVESAYGQFSFHLTLAHEFSTFFSRHFGFFILFIFILRECLYYFQLFHESFIDLVHFLTRRVRLGHHVLVLHVHVVYFFLEFVRIGTAAHLLEKLYGLHISLWHFLLLLIHIAKK